VTIIDRNDYFECVPTNPRSIVKDGYFDEVNFTYGSILKAHGNKAAFIQGSLESINDERKTIEVKTHNGQNQTISFDYLVLATGSTQGRPIKEVDVSTMEERKSKLAVEQEAIKRAQSILVVGAGAVGVEVAGELAQLYSKTKKIGIISRGADLLPYFPVRARQGAHEFMTRHGVTMHLGANYDEAFKHEHQYEHVINCGGATYKTPFMNKSLGLSECVSDRGQIYVNNFL
jgi:NADH dehydrogenase FAD-containing subunit